MRVRWEKGLGVHGRYDPETDIITVDLDSSAMLKPWTLAHELIHKLIHETFRWDRADSDMYQAVDGQVHLSPRYFLMSQFERWFDELDWLIRTGSGQYPVPMHW